MKRTKPFLVIALAALGMTACKHTDFKKTKEGFPYKVFGDSKGELIVPGNVVRYHMTQKLEDSLLGTSYGTPARWMDLPKQGEQNGMGKLLLEAHQGDSILIVQPVDSMLKSNPQLAQDSFLVSKKGKNINTIIKVVEVFRDADAAQAAFEKESIETFYKDPANLKQKAIDDAAITGYLKTANVTNPIHTPWGVYVQSIAPGTGQKAKMGQFMLVRYTGKDLTGKVFDSNDKPGGQLLPVQIGAGGTIPGFQDGLRQLSKGQKATLYIPSVVGYGAQGNPPVIQPNQNLIFDIEVVDITDKAPAPPTMPQRDTTRK